MLLPAVWRESGVYTRFVSFACYVLFFNLCLHCARMVQLEQELLEFGYSASRKAKGKRHLKRLTCMLCQAGKGCEK